MRAGMNYGGKTNDSDPRLREDEPPFRPWSERWFVLTSDETSCSIRTTYEIKESLRHKTIVKPRINSQIIAQELRVVDETGANLGVLSREEALKLAKPELGIDLIEVVPGAKPPVAKLMSYDKYRYEAEKQFKKERLAQKTGGIKHVQISARAATNDLLIKVKQLEKFLAEGNQVEIQMRLRGREKYNRDWARQKLEAFLKMITVEYKRLSDPKPGGQGMFMQIAKK